MNQKTVKLLLLLTTLTVISSLTFAHATDVTSFYDFSNRSSDQELRAAQPSSTAVVSGTSQTFNSTYSGYLTSIILYIQREGSPSGVHVKVELQGCGNALNADPNGTILATSTTVLDPSTLTDGVWSQVTFYFDSTYYLTANTKYAIVIYVDSLIFMDTSNSVHVGYDSSSPAAEGYYSFYYNSAWTGGPIDTIDMVYYVNLEDSTATPGPTAPPSTDTDQLYADLVAFATPLLVMILPAFIMYWVGGRGKWPLLIGLAIGTGLGYVFVADFPLWLVFLVAIGIIGMAYSDVSSGGSYT